MGLDYQKGIEHYRKGGTIEFMTGYSAEFLNGFHFEERHSRCGFYYINWEEQDSE